VAGWVSAAPSTTRMNFRVSINPHSVYRTIPQALQHSHGTVRKADGANPFR
jgi:hypothetical protein